MPVKKKQIRKFNNYKLASLVLFAFLFLAAAFLFFEKTIFAAGVATGNIDPANNYAWSENAGWIDFRPGFGGVNVTDSSLTGYAWGENIGWVSMSCSNTATCGAVNYGVVNDGSGNLSGYAWSENGGWIDFNPPSGGVTINASGDFLGYAWGENIGWIVFNCATTGSCGAVSYKVNTTWRQAGGGITRVFPSNYSLSINGGSACTASNDVDLTIQASGADKYVVSNDASFLGVDWQTFTSPVNLSWSLENGDGQKTVYVLLKSSTNELSPLISASIDVNSDGCAPLPPAPPEPPTTPPASAPPEPITPPEQPTSPASQTGVGETCEIDYSKLILEPYIINPGFVTDSKIQTIYFDNPQYVKVEKSGDSQEIVYFEDNGRDWDFNDFILKLDWQNHKNLSLTALKHDALWHHQVRVKIFYDGKMVSDSMLWPDDSIVPLNTVQSVSICELLGY